MGSRTTDPPPERADAEAGKPSASQPNLPAWKAFVVQFTADSTPDTGTLAGRVEHLASGTRERFASSQELLDCLKRLLGEAGG